LCLSISSCQTTSVTADLVLQNGRIYTVEDPNEIFEAITIKGDMILNIGSNGELTTHINQTTTVIDLEGKTVIPGFIDSHAHFMNLGYLKLNLDLTKTKNWAEILEMVKTAVKNSKPGVWIEGRGWHQEKWEKLPKTMVEGYPVHKDLSTISPNNPVYLKHTSGHAILANQMAMHLAGIDNNTADPAGGRIIRDKKNQPTGIFLENAKDLIDNILNESKKKRSEQEIEENDRQAFHLASKTCLQNGITRFQALRSYTIDAAYAAFEENIKGTLAPGKLADLVVLSKDIMTIPDEEILSTEVLYTIIGGKILYKKN
jgi:predicted amidohydrolase YtcJ